MPTYAPARSDTDRLTTLEMILTTSGLDNDDARLLPVALRTEVQDFLTDYRPVVAALDQAAAGRAREVSEKDAAQERLAVHVRDFFEVLKRRTNRMGHGVAALVHYGLPQAGDLPALGGGQDVGTAADGIVAGEATAVAADLPPMANPSATEVAAALAAYRKESGEVVPADLAVRRAQSAAAELRVRADEILADVKDELSHVLRKLTGPGQRRVLRLFGFKFTPNPGETPEPEPVPVAVV